MMVTSDSYSMMMVFNGMIIYHKDTTKYPISNIYLLLLFWVIKQDNLVVGCYILEIGLASQWWKTHKSYNADTLSLKPFSEKEPQKRVSGQEMKSLDEMDCWIEADIEAGAFRKGSTGVTQGFRESVPVRLGDSYNRKWRAEILYLFPSSVTLCSCF